MRISFFPNVDLMFFLLNKQLQKAIRTKSWINYHICAEVLAGGNGGFINSSSIERVVSDKAILLGGLIFRFLQGE